MKQTEFQAQIESDFDQQTEQIDQLHEEFQLRHNDFMGLDDEVGSQPDIPELTYAEHKAAQKPTEEDDIAKPSHYNICGCDSMPMIEKILGTEAYLGFLCGNVWKYRIRVGKKQDAGILSDVKKALYYEKLYNDFVKRNTP